MNDLRLPWHRETVGHANIGEIADKVGRDLAVPLHGIAPNTDATWIVDADNKVVAFVGNGPRQTENADAIIAAVQHLPGPTPEEDAAVARYVAETEGRAHLWASRLDANDEAICIRCGVHADPAIAVRYIRRYGIEEVCGVCHRPHSECEARNA